MAQSQKVSSGMQSRLAVADAVENADIQNFQAWSDLDVLSSHTVVDQIEVDPAGVVMDEKGSFKGIYSVYVVLKYGNGDESFEDTDAFGGEFEGHFQDETPIIDSMIVDTSPFFRDNSRNSKEA